MEEDDDDDDDDQTWTKPGRRWQLTACAFHKSKPLSIRKGYVDSYSTLPWIKWEAVTGVEVYPVEGYYDTRWLLGLWSTQAMVEGIVLKAAWHWGSDSSVISNPLREPGFTTLYIGLRSTWGSVDGDCFPRISWEGSVLGNLTDINE